MEIVNKGSIKQEYDFELSQPGMKENAIATHKKSGKKYFLKIIITKFMKEQLIQSTYARTLLIGKIKHETVARLHEIFEDSQNGLLYLVFEYLGGDDLFSIVKKDYGRDLPFLEKRASAIIYNIARGVNHLHSRGIIHSNLSVRLKK